MRGRRGQRWIAGGIAIALALCTSAAFTQQRGFRRWFMPRIEVEKTPYDGKFTFARLRHGAEMGREPPWAHDYPRAERNFTHILKELTFIDPNTRSSNVYTQDDPDLFTSPILYVSEPGYWTMTEEELAAMQEYVKKGGFIIFDDFRDEHWYNFDEQVRRLIPGARLIELDSQHPIFNAFFSIRIEETEGVYGPPSFRGVFEDNDPSKRLLLIANYNHDLGELWEYSDTGFVPVDLSNDAYKYGVNYIIYAMTH